MPRSHVTAPTDMHVGAKGWGALNSDTEYGQDDGGIIWLSARRQQQVEEPRRALGNRAGMQQGGQTMLIVAVTQQGMSRTMSRTVRATGQEIPGHGHAGTRATTHSPCPELVQTGSDDALEQQSCENSPTPCALGQAASRTLEEGRVCM